jgi:hypothetical protein
MHDAFRHLARAVSNVVGTPAAFALALVGVLVWIASGPFFHYSDTCSSSSTPEPVKAYALDKLRPRLAHAAAHLAKRT